MSVCHLRVKADAGETSGVIDYVNDILSGFGCSDEARKKLSIAVDEVFSNIVKYAYPGSQGDVEIYVETGIAADADVPEGKKCFSVIFRDRGEPYNPLEERDPDITLDINGRTPGGLGIFLVKKLMDSVEYTYENEMNVLRIMIFG